MPASGRADAHPQPEHVKRGAARGDTSIADSSPRTQCGTIAGLTADVWRVRPPLILSKIQLIASSSALRAAYAVAESDRSNPQAGCIRWSSLRARSISRFASARLPVGNRRLKLRRLTRRTRRAGTRRRKARSLWDMSCGLWEAGRGLNIRAAGCVRLPTLWASALSHAQSTADPRPKLGATRMRSPGPPSSPCSSPAPPLQPPRGPAAQTDHTGRFPSTNCQHNRKRLRASSARWRDFTLPAARSLSVDGRQNGGGDGARLESDGRFASSRWSRTQAESDAGRERHCQRMSRSRRTGATIRSDRAGEQQPTRVPGR